MRSALIVIDPPRFDLDLCLVNRFKPVHVQTFVPHRTVERLDEAVVGRLPRSTEVDLHFVMVSPEIKELSGELAAVIRQYPHGSTPMSDKPAADSDNILASKSKTNLCRERLAGEDVDDRKNPNPSPIDPAWLALRGM